MLMTMPRAWVHETADGRAIHGLGRDQRQALYMTLRRYYAWVDSGRKHDPWQWDIDHSGASGATRFDLPRVKKSPEGYGPGRSSPPEEPDPTLANVDRIVTALAPHQQMMLRSRFRDRRPVAWAAERLGVTLRVYAEEWRKLTTRLYFTIGGQ